MNQSFSQSTASLLFLVALAACGLGGFYFYLQSTNKVDSDTDLSSSGESAVPSDSAAGEIVGGEPDSDGLVAQPVEVTAQSANTAATTAGTDSATKLSARPDMKMPWEDWPKPTVALALTGEQSGYFEPCGCSENQAGGMSRRASLVNKLTSAGWPVTCLDIGGLSRRTGAQAGIKLQTSLNALELAGYQAVGLGIEDLRLGVDRLLDVQMQLMNQSTKLRFLCANVQLLDGALESEGFPQKFIINDVGGLKVGVTSVLSEGMQREVFPLGDAKWSDPIVAITAAMSEFDRQEVQLRVLLSYASVEDSMEYAKQFPQFNVVLTARGVGDPDPHAAPQKVGDTLIVEPGRKGRHVGVLGVYAEGDKLSFRYKLVTLERQGFPETQSMVDLMQKYQSRLKDEQIVLVDGVSAPHPSQSKFVGAAKCGECHTEALKIWESTPHAHALESLDPANKRVGHDRLNGINRSFDPECLACHVTGWDPQEYTRFRSGFLNEEFASNEGEKELHKLLAGSQCENCHGPGSRHIEMVDAGESDAGKSVRVTREQAKKSLCSKCHDGDNSPKFEFDSYWDKVKHYGMD